MDQEKFLFTKSIIKPKEADDARRISVMSRHTKEDGITPDERIIDGETFDEWLQDFAPPAKLVDAYYPQEVTWDNFARLYLEFLRSPEVQPKVEEFAHRCAQETITLMCVEEDSEKCHRRLLAEELQKYQPDLKIKHK